jgi:hypothetical protein
LETSLSLFSNWIFLLYLLQPIKQFDKQQMIVIFFINAMIPLNHTRIQQKTDPTFQYGTRNLQIYKKKIVLSNRLLAWMCEAPSAVKRLSLQVWKLNFQKKKKCFFQKTNLKVMKASKPGVNDTWKAFLFFPLPA